VDILTVTFSEAPKNEATGIELHENVVLYFTPDEGKVLELNLRGYGAMLKDQKPLQLKALTKLQPVWQQKILNMLQKEPANHFLPIEKRDAAPIHLFHIKKVFDPELINAAA